MNIRSFIAIKISKDIRHRLSEVQRRLKGYGADVKWVNPNNIHLTLKFLGSVREDQLYAVAQVMAQAVAGIAPFTLSLGRVGAFPNVRRPKIIFVEAEDSAGSLEKIHHTLNDGLADLGVEKEYRKFNAHLTLGRLKRGGQLGSLADKLESTQVNGPCSLSVDEIVLFSSDLTPEGPLYSVMAKYPLRG